MVPIVTPIVPRSKSHWYQLVTCSASNPMKPLFTLGPASGVQNKFSLGPTVGPWTIIAPSQLILNLFTFVRKLVGIILVQDCFSLFHAIRIKPSKTDPFVCFWYIKLSSGLALEEVFWSACNVGSTKSANPAQAGPLPPSCSLHRINLRPCACMPCFKHSTPETW